MTTAPKALLTEDELHLLVAVVKQYIVYEKRNYALDGREYGGADGKLFEILETLQVFQQELVDAPAGDLIITKAGDFD